MTISPEDWEKTPESIKHLVSDLLARLERSADLPTKAASTLGAAIHEQLPRKRSQIVFLTDRTLPRVSKIARALKSAGIEVILLYREARMTASLERDFSDSIRFENTSQAIFLARLFKPLVYHVFSHWDFSLALALIESGAGKVVFDNYDYCGGMLKPSYIESMNAQSKVEQERRCLEKADGICSRGLELLIPRRRHGYNINAKTILFPDYCVDDATISDERAPEDECRFVYVGHMVVDTKDVNAPDNIHLWLAEKLAALKVHYHIIPATLGEADFESLFRDYIEFSRTCPYFHIEPTIPHEQLISYLSRFDCGVFILSRQYAGSADHEYVGDKHELAVANKIFDFLDAGLPVIIHPGRFARRIVSRRAGIVASDELFSDRESLLRQVKAMRQAVPFRRSQLALSRHIPRLLRFYEAVAE